MYSSVEKIVGTAGGPSMGKRHFLAFPSHYTTGYIIPNNNLAEQIQSSHLLFCMEVHLRGMVAQWWYSVQKVAGSNPTLTTT